MALQPQAFLLPILRNVAMLDEREFGYFVPRGEPEANMPTMPQITPLTSVPEQ